MVDVLNADETHRAVVFSTNAKGDATAWQAWPIID
jgi:hypothetical protein